MGLFFSGFTFFGLWWFLRIRRILGERERDFRRVESFVWRLESFKLDTVLRCLGVRY